MNLNRAQLIGNLTKDPEMRVTPSGQNVVNFSIATNRVWNDSNGQKQEQVEFHNLVAWGKTAEIINQYLKKGAKIFVEGRLQTRSWEDQNNNNIKRYRTEIVVSNMIMLGSKQGNQEGVQQAPIDNHEQPAPQDAEEEINIEDIPF